MGLLCAIQFASTYKVTVYFPGDLSQNVPILKGQSNLVYFVGSRHSYRTI